MRANNRQNFLRAAIVAVEVVFSGAPDLQGRDSLFIRVLKENAPARRFHQALGGQLVLEKQGVLCLSGSGMDGER